MKADLVADLAETVSALSKVHETVEERLQSILYVQALTLKILAQVLENTNEL